MTFNSVMDVILRYVIEFCSIGTSNVTIVKGRLTLRQKNVARRLFNNVWFMEIFLEIVTAR